MFGLGGCVDVELREQFRRTTVMLSALTQLLLNKGLLNEQDLSDLEKKLFPALQAKLDQAEAEHKDLMMAELEKKAPGLAALAKLLNKMGDPAEPNPLVDPPPSEDSA